MVGSGQPLVLGITAGRIEAVADTFDPTRTQLVSTFAGQSQPISRQISGGTLGGLLAFRTDALDPARRELGLAAATLTHAFNAAASPGRGCLWRPGQRIFSRA